VSPLSAILMLLAECCVRRFVGGIRGFDADRNTRGHEDEGATVPQCHSVSRLKDARSFVSQQHSNRYQLAVPNAYGV